MAIESVYVYRAVSELLSECLDGVELVGESFKQDRISGSFYFRNHQTQGAFVAVLELDGDAGNVNVGLEVISAACTLFWVGLKLLKAERAGHMIQILAIR